MEGLRQVSSWPGGECRLRAKDADRACRTLADIMSASRCTSLRKWDIVSLAVRRKGLRQTPPRQTHQKCGSLLPHLFP